MTHPIPPLFRTGPFATILACALIMLIPSSERTASPALLVPSSLSITLPAPLEAIPSWIITTPNMIMTWGQTVWSHAETNSQTIARTLSDRFHAAAKSADRALANIFAGIADRVQSASRTLGAELASFTIPTPPLPDWETLASALEPAAGSATDDPAPEITDPPTHSTVNAEPAQSPRDQHKAPQPAIVANERVQGVLVPQRLQVISSSRDGRIKRIAVDHGDRFRAGDVLVEYECDDFEAEREAAIHEKTYLEKRSQAGWHLLKLGMISDIDALDMQTEAKKAQARIKMHAARGKACSIRADFNGHVTNRLANDSEYTRTDRVLLEIAADMPLRVEFLMPSAWLRWVNRDAPITLTLNENGKTYTGRVVKIHGRVDPISQSIQVIAQLDEYADPLLPGMSGDITLDSRMIADAGITGFLDTP